MTAKPNRKQFSIFLSIAISASVAQCQQSIGADELSLTPPNATMTLTPVTQTAEQTQPRLPPPAAAQNTTPPPRIQRSVLETPRIHSVPVVSPLAEERLDSAASNPDGQESRTADAGDKAQVVGEPELIRARFPNGKPQVERWVAEDSRGNIVNHGQYVEYDQTGVVISSGKYDTGNRVGEWSKQLSHSEAQQLINSLPKGFEAPFSSRATFRQGELDGEWTIADARDKLVAVWSYVAGKRQGQSTQFDPNGEVTQAITYDADLADGPARMPVEDGTVAETTFSAGMMLRQVDKWYPVTAGKPRVLQAQEWHLVPMPLNVDSSDWAGNRIQYRSTEGVKPIRHGLSTTFYPTGQRESEGTYEHGKRTGTFVWWYPNGQQKTVGEYRNDVEHAEWTWWHENGMKHVNGSFADGRQINAWSRWSADGKLVDRSEVPTASQLAERSAGEAETKKR